MTDASGSLVEAYRYNAYGQPLQASTVGNPYMFTGRRFDSESGLYYYRNRYYSPQLRRFIEPDPIGFEGGINLYAYVGNDPGNELDPHGLQAGVIPGPVPFPIILPKTDSQKSADKQLADSAWKWMTTHYNPDNWIVQGWNWVWNENTEDDDGDSCDAPTSPPDGLVENPNRPGSWGEYDENGKFNEKWRFDKGRPEIKRGHGSRDHIHLDGKKRWYPVN